MMAFRKTVAVVFVILCFSGVTNAEDADPVAFKDFENPKSSGLYAKLVRHGNLSIADEDGVGGSKALQAKYVGFKTGSQRIVLSHNLPERGPAI